MSGAGTVSAGLAFLAGLALVVHGLLLFTGRFAELTALLSRLTPAIEVGR